MNADPAFDASTSDDDQLRETLITTCRLSSDAVSQIETAMQVSQLSFSEAALHVGLITRQNIEDARTWMRRLASLRSPSVVETAIRRQVVSRSVTTWHSELVKPTRNLILAHDQDNPRSERLRALRTELLLHSESGRSANLLALVSPCTSEGRSQLTAELAIAFAQLGRRTLLVDADLRRPSQHVLFGADNRSGLSQALASGEAAHLYGVEGLQSLSLLTSGMIPRNPLELLSHGRFERMVMDWRNQYEFVVIDTPPVREFADALAVATVIGRVLVLSRAEVTTHKDMKEMLRGLGSTQSQILGAIINSF